MSFIHSLNTHLWNSCCVPGTVHRGGQRSLKKDPVSERAKLPPP